MRAYLLFVLTAALTAVSCRVALGQSPPPAILTIDLENFVEYRQSILYDPSIYATDPSVTTVVTTARNFSVVTLLGDIVAVNGQPAKGLYVGRTRGIQATPTPIPGNAIADVTRTALREYVFEILKFDGTPVGTLFGSGFSGGPPPPGAPLASQGSNYAIMGGTGAFLGARGQLGEGPGGGRAALISEDPSYRRMNGGNKKRFILHVIPMYVPQIVTTANGPAVTHSSDFTLVTASKPASAGEILSVFLTGLGPTRPGADPGQPFPSTPPATVNSPIEVRVSGNPAELLGAVGFPGVADGYQVNFRIPQGIEKGTATIQVSAAWVAGTPVTVAVQ
jgi:hypothetical protein